MSSMVERSPRVSHAHHGGVAAGGKWRGGLLTRCAERSSLPHAWCAVPHAIAPDEHTPDVALWQGEVDPLRYLQEASTLRGKAYEAPPGHRVVPPTTEGHARGERAPSTTEAGIARVERDHTGCVPPYRCPATPAWPSSHARP